ncbi:hypothetical protein [Alienimonas sp. DA493]|uniref:hypothetical protein n=1 Tax=Alienimonas sp. DA493 TaxID=3373605 RepID=UPI003754276C
MSAVRRLIAHPDRPAVAAVLAVAAAVQCRPHLEAWASEAWAVVAPAAPQAVLLPSPAPPARAAGLPRGRGDKVGEFRCDRSRRGAVASPFAPVAESVRCRPCPPPCSFRSPGR